MAKVRQARRCRARSSRTGEPCRSYAVVGGTVCTAHGGSSARVRVAAAQRHERELVERAMLRAEQRHARELNEWIDARVETAADRLGKPPESVTFEDLRRCGQLYDPPPRPRLDLRFGPRRPVVIRRRR
jgi:hypothetical protein